MRTHTHARTHARTRTPSNSRTRAHAHTRTLAHTLIRTQTRARTPASRTSVGAPTTLRAAPFRLRVTNRAGERAWRHRQCTRSVTANRCRNRPKREWAQAGMGLSGNGLTADRCGHTMLRVRAGRGLRRTRGGAAGGMSLSFFVRTVISWPAVTSSCAVRAQVWTDPVAVCAVSAQVWTVSAPASGSPAQSRPRRSAAQPTATSCRSGPPASHSR